MLTAKSRESPKIKAEATSAGPKSRLEPAARVQANPLWHRLATRVQPKLTVGAPNDRFEQEADRVADDIMRMPDAAVSGRIGAGGAPTERIQRVCPECEEELQRQPAEDEEEEEIRMKPASGPTPEIGPGLEARIEGLRGGGEPLPPSVRSFFEPRFGYDFSQVRVHTDARAAESARAVNALAYTVGREVVFGKGEFTPGSAVGRRLLAHELAHTVQQGTVRSPDPGSLRIGRANDPSERAAEPMANRVASGGSALGAALAATGPAVQRACGPAEIGSVGGCIGRGGDFGFSSDDIYLFDVNCDVFATGEQARLERFARTISVDATVEIDGFASGEGDPDFNEELSCARAKIAEDIVIRESGASTQAYMHGGTPGDRPTRRSVVLTIREPRPEQEPEAEQITVCIPPSAQESLGKRCKFYVYDSTEPTGMAWKWKVAAFAYATPRPGAYVIPSGANIEEALKGILDTYASKDCGCTEEVQFWSHGSPANAMSITKTDDELTIKDFNIPELKKFGYGPTSMPGYREWHSKLSTRQRCLVLLRRTICDPDAEIYYRSCEAFQGKEGQEFAKASTEFWRSKVVGHTKVIALTQPGKKVLKLAKNPTGRSPKAQRNLPAKSRWASVQRKNPKRTNSSFSLVG